MTMSFFYKKILYKLRLFFIREEQTKEIQQKIKIPNMSLDISLFIIVRVNPCFSTK